MNLFLIENFLLVKGYFIPGFQKFELKMQSRKNEEKKPINRLHSRKSAEETWEHAYEVIEEKKEESKEDIILRHKKTKKIFSLISIEMPQNQYRLNQLRKKLKQASKIKHPHIRRLRNYYEDRTKSKMNLVLENCKMKNLKEFTKEKRELKEKDAFIIFFQCCLALEKLNQENIENFSIDYENILLDPFQNVKFDLSWILSQENKKGKKNLLFLAPELIQAQSSQKTEQSWSLGIVLYLLTQSKLPFGSKEEILSYKGNIETKSIITENCKILLKQLLSINPLQRIKLPQIFKSPWMTKYQSKFQELDTLRSKTTQNRRETLMEDLDSLLDQFNLKGTKELDFLNKVEAIAGTKKPKRKFTTRFSISKEPRDIIENSSFTSLSKNKTFSQLSQSNRSSISLRVSHSKLKLVIQPLIKSEVKTVQSFKKKSFIKKTISLKKAICQKSVFKGGDRIEQRQSWCSVSEKLFKSSSKTNQHPLKQILDFGAESNLNSSQNNFEIDISANKENIKPNWGQGNCERSSASISLKSNCLATFVMYNDSSKSNQKISPIKIKKESEIEDVADLAQPLFPFQEKSLSRTSFILTEKETAKLKEKDEEGNYLTLRTLRTREEKEKSSKEISGFGQISTGTTRLRSKEKMARDFPSTPLDNAVFENAFMTKESQFSSKNDSDKRVDKKLPPKPKYSFGKRRDAEMGQLKVPKVKIESLAEKMNILRKNSKAPKRR